MLKGRGDPAFFLMAMWDWRTGMKGSENSAKAFIFLLERGLIEPPAMGSKWICLNAQELPQGGSVLKSHLVCEQGFRPTYDQLKQAGYEVSPQLSQSLTGDAALVFAGRSRRQNEHWIARAWNMLPEGAPIFVAGEKTSGIASLRKWAGQLSEVVLNQSKHHAVVFSIKPTGSAPELLTDDKVEGFATSPGMFSSGRIDEGSRLLADQFDTRISGRVADLGSGWGFLSVRLLEASAGITSLDCYEADWASLKAAEQNLTEFTRKTEIRFHWRDVVRESIEPNLDWIIMNPPFHSGRAAQPAIGTAFIKAAAGALKTGGRLLMVANRTLPYERELGQCFQSLSQRMDNGAFKVFEAVR